MVTASATSSAKSSADLEPATEHKHLTDPKMPRLIVAAFSFKLRRDRCQFSQLVYTESLHRHLRTKLALGSCRAFNCLLIQGL